MCQVGGPLNRFLLRAPRRSGSALPVTPEQMHFDRERTTFIEKYLMKTVIVPWRGIIGSLHQYPRREHSLKTQYVVLTVHDQKYTPFFRDRI